MSATTPATTDASLATYVPSRLVIRECDTPIRLVVLPRVGSPDHCGHDLDDEEPEGAAWTSSSGNLLPAPAAAL